MRATSPGPVHTTAERKAAPATSEGLSVALAATIAPIVRDALADALAEHEVGAAPKPALLNTEELAHELRTSPSTIHRLRKAGLPVIMLIESPRYELSAVLSWLKAREKGAGDASDS
jgi:hypothetical protein